MAEQAVALTSHTGRPWILGAGGQRAEAATLKRVTRQLRTRHHTPVAAYEASATTRAAQLPAGLRWPPTSLPATMEEALESTRRPLIGSEI